ncbi:MAG: hypothetical protein D6760_06180 [Deltaproteobacteria bacterium]|nr:MAG: hypothetical protein D6760_06180 [Deltaproteobacteria bacterium]
MKNGGGQIERDATSDLDTLRAADPRAVATIRNDENPPAYVRLQVVLPAGHRVEPYDVSW